MMRPAAITALLLSTTLHAQKAPQPPTARAAPNGHITGFVLCGDTRKPARGALVFIAPLPTATPEPQHEPNLRANVRTGMDGSFHADHLVPGEYTVTALLPGYLSVFDAPEADDIVHAPLAERRAFLSRDGVANLHANETAHITLILQRGAAVSGHVSYSDGTPATQVSLDLEDIASKAHPDPTPGEPASDTRMFRSMFTQQSLSTDDRGNFRLAGIAPGTYRIAAMEAMGDYGGPIGTLYGGAALDTSALRFYAGDTLHSKAAKTYELRAGDELTGIEITLPDRLFHRIAGTALGTPGRRPNNGTVTLTDTTDPNLRFTCGLGNQAEWAFPVVPSGTYTLALPDAEYDPPDFPGLATDIPAKPYVAPQNTLYAPYTQTLLLKDSDLTGLTLPLTELPPDKQPKPTPTGSESTESQKPPSF